MMINGKTTILAVFGDPIDHSLSPTMHNAAFKELGWNCVYIPCHVLPEDVTLAVRGIRSLGMKGVNITIPHKQAVVPELDEIFGDASLSGSVNTIINDHGKLRGTSTDGTGLVRSLREDGQFEVSGKRCLILGAGGSASALVFRLIAEGIRSLTVVNRDFTKALNLRERVWHATKFEVEAYALSELENLNWDAFDLLINTTSVGLHDSATLVPQQLLNPRIFVYDIVYKPGNTTLINDAVAQGCRVLTGLSLLLYQGADSFRLWFDTEPPIEVMRHALLNSVL